MGLTIKNKNNYELADNLASFFALDVEEDLLPDYTSLKYKVYDSDLDTEEKSNIVNKINSLKVAKTMKEQQKIIREIESLKDRYDL